MRKKFFLYVFLSVISGIDVKNIFSMSISYADRAQSGNELGENVWTKKIKKDWSLSAQSSHLADLPTSCSLKGNLGWIKTGENGHLVMYHRYKRQFENPDCCDLKSNIARLEYLRNEGSEKNFLTNLRSGYKRLRSNDELLFFAVHYAKHAAFMLLKSPQATSTFSGHIFFFINELARLPFGNFAEWYNYIVRLEKVFYKKLDEFPGPGQDRKKQMVREMFRKLY